MPPLDSAFATAFGIKSGKVEDLRAEVASNLRLELKRKVEGVLRDQAMSALREKTQIALPNVAGRDGVARASCAAWRATSQQQGMKAEDIKLDAGACSGRRPRSASRSASSSASSCATRTCNPGPSR